MMKKMIVVSVAAMLCLGATANAENIQENNKNGTLPVYGIDIRKPKQEMSIMSNELPDKFDLRDIDGKSYVSSVKDQGYTNNCWAYAFAASVESCWLRDTDGREEIDVSEYHIDYSLSDELMGQSNPDGVKNGINDGGQPFLAAAYAVRGSGVVLDDDFPDSDHSYDTYLSELYVQPSFGVTEAIITNYYDENNAPDFTDSDYDDIIKRVKNDLYTNRTAITTSMLYDYDFGGSLYPTFYNPNGGYNQASHSLAIVGWDDSYPAENFNVAPRGDGAWIVKDSWGVYNEDGSEIEGHTEGFCYVSYYDLSAYHINTQITGMEDYRDGLPYDNRYYHDKSWFLNSLGYENKNTAYGMNVFEKQSGDEKVVSVNVAFNGPTDYEVYIVDDANDVDSIDVSELTPYLSGHKSYAGYYELDLEEPVEVSGESFAVIVKYSDNSSDRLVPVSQKAEYGFWWHDVCLTFEPGISFVSADGTQWDDISEDNKVCSIKAFTKDVEPKSVVSVEKYDDGSTQYGFNGEKATYVKIYDENGKLMNANADGTYSLRNGSYSYVAERSTSSSYRYAPFIPVSGDFEVNGDMTLQITVPSEYNLANNLKPPSASGDRVYEFYPFLTTYLNISHSYGTGALAATDAELYMEIEEGIRVKLEKDVDYSIDNNGINLYGTTDYSTDTFTPYLLGDIENVLEMQNEYFILYVKYNDTAQTECECYVYVYEADLFTYLNSYLASELNATKEGIENYLKAVPGMESVSFSNDFEISPMKINGTVTIVYKGTTYTRDYTGYTRFLEKMIPIKRTVKGQMYKRDILDYSYNNIDYYFSLIVGVYNADGELMETADEYYHRLDYMDVPEDAVKMKMFSWEGFYDSIKPLTGAIEYNIK